MTQHASRSDIKQRLARHGVAALAVAVAVWGCTPDLAIQPAAQTQTQWIQLSQKVPFGPGQANFSGTAAQAIDRFLARAEVSYGDRIVIKSGPIDGDAGSQRLAAQRAEVIKAYLARHRIVGEYSPAADVTVGTDEAAVVVGRYLAVLPDCAEWRTVMAGGGINAETDRFGIALGGARPIPVKDRPLGCVTASALGAMIADPGDLVEPGSMGPGDGQFLARGSARYRAGGGKVEKAASTKKGN